MSSEAAPSHRERPTEPKSIGDQELALLQWLAERGGATVGEAAESFGAGRDLARSTVLTMMERLRKKGHLTRRKEAGVYRYTSPVPAAEVLKSVVGGFVEQTLGGSVSPFVAFLADSEGLSRERAGGAGGPGGPAPGEEAGDGPNDHPFSKRSARPRWRRPARAPRPGLARRRRCSWPPSGPSAGPPRLSPGLRCGLWWAVGLKLLLALIWIAPFEWALLPAPPVESIEAIEAAEAAPWVEAAVVAPLGAIGPAATTVTSGAAPAPLPTPALPWRSLLVWTVFVAWAAGVAYGLARLGRDLAAVRRLRRASEPVDDPALQGLFDDLRERLGFARAVDLRVADGLPSPVTVGLDCGRPCCCPRSRRARSRPPAGARSWRWPSATSCSTCAGATCGRAGSPSSPAVLFFFHPLAALAAREHILAREAACDAAVLRELGAPAGSYGRLLLRWSARASREGREGDRRSDARLPEIAAAAGASTTFQHLKRRLEMLQRSTDTSRPSRAGKLLAGGLVLVAALVLAPVRIVAHAPPPPEPPAPPAAPEAPPAPPAPMAPTASVPAPPAPPEAPPAPPAPPNAMLAQAPPAPPAPPKPPKEMKGYSYGWWDDGEGWALMSPGDNVWMSNGHMDRDRVQALRRDDEPLVWFSRDGREYVIRDRATIARLESLLEPQMELGRRQGELGGRQGEVGGRQGELGRQQGELGRQQGELGARQAELAAEQAALGWSDDSAERDELRERRRALSERMRELGERQRELGQRQRELAERQRAMGSEQREWGERQRALGHQQREAAEEARPKIRALFDRAIADGTAEAI